MPILTLQRRLRQAGRLRIGSKVPTSSGKERPNKLDAFRLTSPDKAAIEAAAEAYGGDVQQWDGAAVGVQWECFTKSKDIDVIVPPTDLAFSQFFEEWKSGLCSKRCDGITNVLTDCPCSCDPESPDCKPTTRLNLILAAIEGVGVWRLETRGWNSAAELSGSIEVLKVMQSQGAMVPGRMMLEQRQSKSLDKDGKAQTFNFAVPVLDFRVSVASLTGGVSHAALPAGPPVTIIPRDDEVGTPSVAEQFQASQNVVQKPARANAAASLPRTGVKPRGMPTGPSSEEDDVSQNDVEVVHAPKPAADDRTPGGASKSSLRKLMACIRGAKDVPDTDDGRHEWAVVALDTPVASFNDLSQEQISHLIDVASGKKPLIPDTAEDLSAPF